MQENFGWISISSRWDPTFILKIMIFFVKVCVTVETGWINHKLDAMTDFSSAKWMLPMMLDAQFIVQFVIDLASFYCDTNFHKKT
jgi:hypothetical protein